MSNSIVLTRIDDRLIHGQVMTSWLNYTSATKIMVVDDRSAQDPFLKTVLKNAVPKNVGLGVFTAEKAANRLIKGFPESDRVIILVKYPATIKDLEAVTSVEAECFPPAEAATREELAERLKYYADHFWLMFDGDKLIAFVDGFVTDEENLTDEMYAKAQLHNESGAWQMIFGVNTIPAYRKHGYAGELIKCAIEDARKQERKGLVLTCKDHLVQYYAKFGFENEGVSESEHGGVKWNQMRLKF